MKNLLFGFLLLISFSACNTNETPTPANPGNPNPNPTTAFVKFKVDGVQFQYNLGTTFLDNEVEQLGFSYNDGNGNNQAFIILTYDASSPLGLNTYNLTENGFNNIWFKKSNTDLDNNEYFVHQTGNSGVGSITITKMKLIPSVPNVYAINGTFSGTLYNRNGASILITEGEFFNPLTN